MYFFVIGLYTMLIFLTQYLNARGAQDRVALHSIILKICFGYMSLLGQMFILQNEEGIKVSTDF